eukprot:TRINITY_DN26477_c0_g1_i1.p1 TRINITY_DN26477_c0_g1~~TRINITY_DN26477_c0_g1_i1.p1  ORF type:complete len:270 (+),score=56.81 TRINITY_DN26477_c0_g1_i1:26-835(+)
MAKMCRNKCRQEDDFSASAQLASVLRQARAVHLEDWQEDAGDGLLRCKPCHKIIDPDHLTTDGHKVRLERWLKEQDDRAQGYQEPELPYLAWVPYEERKELMCLLCRRSSKPNGTWVTDLSSHSGTHINPAGSKEHQRNLRNYPPSDPWYIENVTQARLKYHPKRHTESHQAAVPSAAPAQLPTPATDASVAEVRSLVKASNKIPTVLANDNPKDALSWLETGKTVAEIWLEPETPAQLPPGWESAQDNEGNTYYYHREERISQWEVPE